MRYAVFFLLMSLGPAVTGFAQNKVEVEVKENDSDLRYLPTARIYPAVAAKDAKQYTFELTMFRPGNRTDANLPVEKLIEQIKQASKDGGELMVETIRLSALENIESTMQVGSTSSQTIATAFTGRGNSRSFQRQNVGTLVKVTPRGLDNKVLLFVNLESSRLGKSSGEDVPAEILTATWSATLLVEPGKPALVGSMSGDKSTLLLVTLQP